MAHVPNERIVKATAALVAPVMALALHRPVMPLSGRLRRWLKSRETRAARLAYAWIMALRRFELPVIPAVHLSLYHLHGAVLSFACALLRVAWWTPLFRARLASPGRHLRLMGIGMPLVLGPLTLRLGEPARAGDVSCLAQLPMIPAVICRTIQIAGSTRAVLEFLSSLPAQEIAAFILNFDYPSTHPTFTDMARARGLRVETVVQKGPFEWRHLPRVRAMAREFGASLIELHSFKAHLTAWPVGRALELPWIAWAHGWTLESHRVRINNAVEKRLLRLPAQVIAVSQPIADTLRSAGRRRPIALVPNAVAISHEHDPLSARCCRGRFGIPEETFLFVSIGRLSFEKGHDVLVKAMARLPETPAHHLLLVGAGP